MQLFTDLNQVDLPASLLTIGSFDGVHRGHQVLLGGMVEQAAAGGIPPVALTFFPHPAVVLHNLPAFYLTDPDEKASLLGELGVEIIVQQPFDLALSRVRAADFIHRLQEHLGFRGLWVGSDFALGHNREGDIPYLREAGSRLGFEVHAVKSVTDNGQPISSTRVRQALRKGDVETAQRLLGRPYSLQGVVVSGAGRGKQLGLPTANLQIWPEHAFPAVGVYACLAAIAGATHQAVTNIGVRPTFDSAEERPVVETHLLDFDRKINGEQLQLAFICRLRDEKRFPSAQELLNQIGLDIQRARQILAGQEAPDG
jgi:riboflavin kinase/FMN adenylyltransferase